MDNTKDLIKEHLAKIVAEEICKDQNVLEELKAEVLRDILPAKIVEEETKKTELLTEPVAETKQEPISIEIDLESPQEKLRKKLEAIKNPPLNKNSVPSTSFLSDFLEKINNEPLVPTLEKLKPKLKGDYTDKWQTFIHKEKQLDNPEKSPRCDEFTFNPTKIPDSYKSVIASGATTKTYPSNNGSIFSPSFNNSPSFGAGFMSFSNSLKKNGATPGVIKTRTDKSLEEIHEQFFKEHAIPPDVSELLAKSEIPTSKNTRSIKKKIVKSKTQTRKKVVQMGSKSARKKAKKK